jgi:uncharacterized protein YbjT (DUF2867 family)
MRVLVTGAYGLIGSAILTRLVRDHAVTGAGRKVAAAAQRFPAAQWIAADFNTLTSAGAWRPLLESIDAVVNCVGVLQDGLRDDSHRVHVEATAALFSACEQARMRVIHISAIGAEASGPTEFSRRKAQAEQDLARRDVDWVVLRPALVLAGAVYGGSAMLRAVAAFLGVTPLIAADSNIQVVSVEDVAETVARCLAPGAPTRVSFDVAHPHVHKLSDIVAAIRRWLGFPTRPLVRVPHFIARVIGLAADALGLLGWRSPARTTALKQLELGVVGDPAPWIAATGIQPMSLDAILKARPANVQDRWFARLYLLKPIAIAGLAFFWFITGAIALGPARVWATAEMIATGTRPDIASLTVILGAWFDVAMGLLLCVRRLARGTLIVMIVATFGYLAAGTLLAPHLWLDPLGPLTKIIPMLVATALTLAIIDER